MTKVRQPLLAIAAFFWLIGAGAPAAALPIYAARERMACINCHVDPSGGGLRNAFGFEYLRNRHALTPESRWPDLPEDQPELAPKLPVGGDLRILYDALHDRTKGGFPSEVSSFYRMQGAFYLSYAPIEQVRAYYNQDMNGVRDLWAMIRSSGGDKGGGGYLRIGAFRPPYGLRLDDHTVYERDGPPAYSVLGFDPRIPDAGVEGGWIHPRLFAQAALTNGSGPGFDPDRGKAFTARLGGWEGPALAGVTMRFERSGVDTKTDHRRFGVYGALSALQDVVLMGALDLGEDERNSALDRSLFAWGEGDYFFQRAARLRLRYEFLDQNRDFEFGDSERYVAELDWTPLPFNTLRVSYRFTSNEAQLGSQGQTIPLPDIEEVFGFWHFHF